MRACHCHRIWTAKIGGDVVENLRRHVRQLGRFTWAHRTTRSTRRRNIARRSHLRTGQRSERGIDGLALLLLTSNTCCRAACRARRHVLHSIGRRCRTRFPRNIHCQVSTTIRAHGRRPARCTHQRLVCDHSDSGVPVREGAARGANSKGRQPPPPRAPAANAASPCADPTDEGCCSDAQLQPLDDGVQVNGLPRVTESIAPTEVHVPPGH